jgi:hypothetical protein
MAGPLNGLGAGAQIPLSNTFQPGQKDIRPETDPKAQENTVKARAADAAGSHRTDTARANVIFSASDSRDDDAPQRRGSLLDISV